MCYTNDPTLCVWATRECRAPSHRQRHPAGTRCVRPKATPPWPPSRSQRSHGSYQRRESQRKKKKRQIAGWDGLHMKNYMNTWHMQVFFLIFFFNVYPLDPWGKRILEPLAELPTSTFLPYFVRFLKENTAVRFFLQKYVYCFFFRFFFFIFFYLFFYTKFTRIIYVMKTWSEFLNNNVQK